MSASKGRKGYQKNTQLLTEDDYGELAKKADLATSALYGLRHKAQVLREDIGDREDTVASLESDIRGYIDEINSRIIERIEELHFFRDRTYKDIIKMEEDMKKRLKEIEAEKEDIEKERTRTLGQAEFLRVRLAEYEQSDYLELNQRERINALKEILNRNRVQQEVTREELKADFTRDMRKMKREYNEKMNLTNECAKKLIRPCIRERIDGIRESNTNSAHSMRRISQKQGILSRKMSKLRCETILLRFEYELWKEIQWRKLLKCDPRLALVRNYSIVPEAFKNIETVLPEDLSGDKASSAELTPYEKLKLTLRSLLRPEESSTESEVVEESENMEEHSSEYNFD